MQKQVRARVRYLSEISIFVETVSYYDDSLPWNQSVLSLKWVCSAKTHVAGGGVNGTGTVFEMTPAGGGNWSETVLHNFGPAFYTGDGNRPLGGLILDMNGNLYGLTYSGGTYNAGTVFEVTP